MSLVELKKLLGSSASSAGVEHPILAAAMARAARQIPQDDPSAWSFSLDSGTLGGPTAAPAAAKAASLRATVAVVPSQWEGGSGISPLLPLPLPLQVSFTPPREGLFVSRFRVIVQQGEGVDIVVVGTGTLNEED